MLASDNQVIARGSRAAVVIGVHAVLIYAIGTSLGLVEVPHLAKPMEAMLIDVPEAKEIKPPTPEPQLADPVVDMPVLDVVPEIPVEVPVERAPAEAPILTAPSEAAGSAELEVTRRVDPVYPAASRRASEEGTGVFRVLVDENGRPKDISVVKSSGFARLDQAAINAIRRWLFAPARQGARAVSSYTTVRVTFRLDG